MSGYVPKVGDRVRVVLEGVATHIATDYFEVGTSSRNFIIPSAEHVVSVEKIADPLPTTPESVVRGLAHGEVRVLGRDGQWRGSDGFRFDSLGNQGGYEVIFDAGATS